MVAIGRAGLGIFDIEILIAAGPGEFRERCGQAWRDSVICSLLVDGLIELLRKRAEIGEAFAVEGDVALVGRRSDDQKSRDESPATAMIVITRKMTLVFVFMPVTG